MQVLSGEPHSTTIYSHFADPLLPVALFQFDSCVADYGQRTIPSVYFHSAAAVAQDGKCKYGNKCKNLHAPQDKGPGAPKSGAPKWGDDGGVGDDSFEVYLNPGALKQGDINSFAGDFVTWAPEPEDPSRRLNCTKITDLLELIDKDISCVKVIACPPEISLRRVSSIAR